MGQKSFWQYQRMVWWNAAQKAWEWMGMRGRLITLVMALSVGVGVWLMTPSHNIDISQIVISVGVLIVLWLLVVIVFAIREPVIIYNTQAAKLSRYENANVSLTITPYNQPKIKPNYQQASVYVTNNESVDLTECIGTLTKVTYIWPQEVETDYKDIIVLPRHFAWSSRSRLGDRHSVTIRPGDYQKAILDIAGASNGEMVFTFVEGSEPVNRMTGHYLVSLTISGKKNGTSFETNQNTFYLDFSGGDLLSIRSQT